MKAQGQNADCGTDLSSIEEGELMDCDFRDDALGNKKDKMKKLWKKKQVIDMLLLQDMNATVDFSYLVYGDQDAHERRMTRALSILHQLDASTRLSQKTLSVH